MSDYGIVGFIGGPLGGGRRCVPQRLIDEGAIRVPIVGASDVSVTTGTLALPQESRVRTGCYVPFRGSPSLLPLRPITFTEPWPPEIPLSVIPDEELFWFQWQGDD